MNPFLASSLLCRVTTWTVTVAMLLPTVVACTAPTPYADAATARLDGIVVDGTRRAGEREPGLAVVIRSGVRQEAYAGMTLQPGDRIDTGPRADAVLRYTSGTELVLRPNSGGRIGSLSDFVGEVFVKVKGFFSVDTTFVKAGARGTAYLVRTHTGGATSVVVIEGIVDVGSTTGAWPTVPLSAGTMALAHPRAPQPMPANVDDLARTRDWVERVERLVPPPSGVSRSALIAIGFAAAIAAAVLLSRTTGSDRGDPPATSSTPAGAGTRDTRPPPTPPPPREPR
jgi:ferric-dicitrate binding protein FerR (iron transport regulator)